MNLRGPWRVGAWRGVAGPALREPGPRQAYERAGRWQTACALAAAPLIGSGLALALVLAPADGPHGDAMRMASLHLPPAWLAVLLYLLMALAAAAGLALRSPLAATLAAAVAPSGALMSALALWTGALWGKPLWGQWWAWDARTASTLSLLALFIGCMALRAGADEHRRGERAAAWLALAGLPLLPLLWGAANRPLSIDGLLLGGALQAAAGFAAWSAAAVLHRLRSMLLEQPGAATWALQP